jgi:hypothetical protein
MRGRLTDEFRTRTKLFAAQSIRLYVKLPKVREEVRVLGKQLLRSGTSVAAHAWPVKYNDDLRLRASLYSR